jgi:hypothetical protein
VWAEDALFSAKLPINGEFYAVTARIHSQKNGDSIEFSAKIYYNSVDTSFLMHTTGVYNTASESPIWQNSIRDAVYSVEWNFRDYVSVPAVNYWHKSQGKDSITFENDAIPEEFLYFLTEKINSKNVNKELKILAPVWEVPFVPGAWIVDAKYTGYKIRFHGVDCYQVVYTRRSDGAKAEYYVTEKGKQIWRFQTFRGVWFERIINR